MRALVTRRQALFTFAGVLALAGCSPTGNSRLRMACGEPGGTYVQFGTLLGDAVVAADAAANIEVLTTDGSIDNMRLLRSGEAQLAIALADSVADDPAGLVALGRVYQNYLQCIVRTDNGIVAATDLAGRRVSIGAPGSGTAFTSARVLEALGLLGDGGAIVEEWNLADAVTGLADGTIDALFWSGGIPLPELDRREPSLDVTLIDVAAALPILGSATSVYQSTVVPAGLYGLEAPLPTIGVSNLLLAHPSLDPAIAAAIVDVLIDDASDLVPDPSEGVQYLTPSNLIDTAPVPLHDAAERRYRERYG